MTNPGVADGNSQDDSLRAALRKSLAAEHGYQGEAGETFAGLITGDDEETMRESAAKLADLGRALNPGPTEPPSQMAVDPSQGKGMETPLRDVEMKRFADSIFDRILYRQPGGWH